MSEPSAIPAKRLARSERFIAVAAILLGICVLAILLGLANLARIHDTVLAEVAKTRAARTAVYGLMQSTIDAETGQRGYLLTTNDEFLAPYESGRAAALAHLAQLRELTQDNPELHASVARADSLAQRAFEQLAAPLDHRGALAQDELRELLTLSKSSMDALRAEVQSLLREVERLVDAARTVERENTDRLYFLGGLLTLFSMIALALTFWALYTERQMWRRTFAAMDEARAAAEDAREAAAASELAKTRFLAVASHDMRQPLHALTLYLSALDRRVENEEARGILAKMERATDSMITMFSTLLDLARIQAGVVDPEISTFALQEVFDRIAAEHAEGSLEIIPTAIALDSDPVLIERALRNLVTNAMKHGGGAARLSAREAGDRAEIVVADEGPGISPEDQSRIFDEFVRVERRGGAQGLGLGLAIVRGIAKALDMPIDVQSEMGRGARFILRPRLSAAAAPGANLDAGLSALDGAPTLVVDDDTFAREAIARVLSDIGADVRTAADETEAQAQFADGFAPKLLIMDLRIENELLGVDIAKRLGQQLDPPPHVIVVTGETSADTLAMLRESGFAWLVKPVSPRVLSEAAAAQLAEA